MNDYQQLINSLSLMLGASWAAGINLYAVISMLGIMGLTGNITLPDQLVVLQHPLVIGAGIVMYVIEFFVDKTPGVDTGWDTLHTFIRIPAGVVLAAGVMGEVNPALVVAAGIVGGGVAATSHSVKAGSRAMINTSPEPVTNWTASIVEDIAVIGGIWTALHYPVVFLGLFILFILLSIWLHPKIIRGIRLLLSRFTSSSKNRQTDLPSK